jgi:hypothetical protein
MQQRSICGIYNFACWDSYHGCAVCDGADDDDYGLLG